MKRSFLTPQVSTWLNSRDQEPTRSSMKPRFVNKEFYKISNFNNNSNRMGHLKSTRQVVWSSQTQLVKEHQLIKVVVQQTPMAIIRSSHSIPKVLSQASVLKTKRKGVYWLYMTSSNHSSMLVRAMTKTTQEKRSLMKKTRQSVLTMRWWEVQRIMRTCFRTTKRHEWMSTKLSRRLKVVGRLQRELLNQQLNSQGKAQYRMPL